jgi:hypothetical protein
MRSFRGVGEVGEVNRDEMRRLGKVRAGKISQE